jgi:hypothetical protein
MVISGFLVEITNWFGESWANVVICPALAVVLHCADNLQTVLDPLQNRSQHS